MTEIHAGPIPLPAASSMSQTEQGRPAASRHADWDQRQLVRHVDIP